MKRLTALLFSLLLLSACSSKEPPEPAAKPAPPPKEEVTAPPKAEPAPPVVLLNGEEIESDSLFDQDPGTGISMAQDSELRIEWPESQSIDRFYLEGLHDQVSVAVYKEDEPVYQQENLSEERWCFLPHQDTDSLTFQFAGENMFLSGFQAKEKTEQPLFLSAYLPFSAFRDSAAEDGTLDGLHRLIINTACYWTSDGTLLIQDGLQKTLETIRAAYPQMELWCTINPQGSMVREGTAGESIGTAAKRKVLIDNMIDFCQENSLTGIDIDWEFPEEDEWTVFSQLITEAEKAFDSCQLSLSLALYPDMALLSQEAVKALSQVNIMAYDQFDGQGRHSTYETARYSVQHFMDMGFQPHQLSLGIPAYGRPVDASAQWPLYADAADALANGTNLLDNVFYNSPQLAQDKAVLSDEMGLGSVFLYHLGCDIPGNAPDSLKTALRKITG